MNYLRFLTKISTARKPSAIRDLTQKLLSAPPSMISMAGGMPNSSLFPFESAQIKLRDGSCLNISEQSMAKALQYGASSGFKELVDWLKKLQLETHRPPNMLDGSDNFDLCVTSGCQEAIAKTVDMLVNRGDNVLIEAPTFPGTINAFEPYGCNFLKCDLDKDGLRPESLLEQLSRWKPEDSKNPDSDIPKLLYTIPNGGNPSGYSSTLARRKEIYQIASKYDLLIMEDDPYYFLQFQEPEASFQTLDEDGRVIRFDSFSKILSSGLRLGYVSGPKPFINKIVQHLMVSSMHPSMMSQVMIYETLNHWGLENYRNHVEKVCSFYRSQKDHTMKAAQKWLTGKAEWFEPQAGLFLWLKLHGVKDTDELISKKAFDKGVACVPGKAFMPGYAGEPCPYVRVSFSIPSAENIDKGFERLAEAIEEHWTETGYIPSA